MKDTLMVQWKKYITLSHGNVYTCVYEREKRGGGEGGRIQIIQKKAGNENRNEKGNKQKTNNKIVGLNTNTSLITLDVNGLNIPIKRQRLAEYIKKPTPTKTYDPDIWCLQIYLKHNDISMLKVKG